MVRSSQDVSEQPDRLPQAAQGAVPGVSGSLANWDAFTEQVLRELLTAFQQIEVTVGSTRGGAPLTVRVHMPYMMQSVTILDDQAASARLKPKHQDRLRRVKAARDAAPPAVKAFLQEQFYATDGGECYVAKGRASPEDVQVLLQEAVDRGLVPFDEGKAHPDAGDLRGWLRRYGVGVDCSGFVQYALNAVLAASYAALGRTPAETEGTGFVRAGWVYRQASADLRGSEARFRPVPTPAQARPGDVLVSPGHIRVVVGTAARTDGAIVLDLAESTSALGIPCGLSAAEADIGPRLIQVCYPAPARPIRAQVSLRRGPGESAFQAAVEERQYVLGRFRAFERARAVRVGRRAAGLSTTDE
jgi:hypothetical protein